jgi:hypothetical protein
MSNRYCALAILCWLALSAISSPVAAHHGGIGIEGDLVEWALNIDQWQEEQIDQGHRIKFLAYPRQPVRGGRTRLIFEIQAVATGAYVGGLSMQLRMQTPDGAVRTVPLPETTGVTAYYETAVEFAQVGEYRLTAISTTPDASFQATFQRHVSPNALLGDWATITGNLTVLATFTMTWVGLIVAVQRRFTAFQVDPNP